MFLTERIHPHNCTTSAHNFAPINVFQTHQNIHILLDGVPDLVADGVLGALQVVPGLAGVVHQGEELVVEPDQLEVLALHVGHLHVVGGGADVLQLLAGEDVEGHHVDLGVAVLASLRGGHLHDLARAALGARGQLEDGGLCPPTLIMTKPPLRSAEHCMGKVSEAPESPWLKS